MNAYAGYYLDEKKLKSSSSGGVASAIAEAIIDRGGIVYGAVYSEDFHSVLYGYAEKKNELWKFKGSKYVYVNKYVMKDGDKILVYKDVISEIKKERIVLFTGLGCDIAYLEKLVRKEAVDARKLFTIELMCDGVTDEIVQREFVLDIEKKYRTKVIDFNIRYKEEGWVPAYIYARFENGKEYKQLLSSSEYGFASLNYKKKACYECQFKGENHQGDIIAADFWGCRAGMKEYNQNGVSLILIQSDKGNILLNYLDREQFYLRKTDAQYALFCNPRYFTAHDRYEKWDLFDSIIRKKGLHKAVKVCAELSVPDRFTGVESNELVLWGTGRCFNQYVAMIKEMCSISLVVDSDEKKWGKELECGFICQSPNILKGKEDIFVLIMIENVSSAFQVANKLLDMKIGKFDHISNWLFYADMFEKV